MEIHNTSYGLTSEALLCFSQAPGWVCFLPGQRLYRFASMSTASFKGNEVFSSPWWFPPETFRQITKTAHRTGASAPDVARSRLAIAQPWNPTMDWLTIFELKKAVHGWVGPTKAQPISGSANPAQRTVMLPGSYDQAYVPGLAPAGAMSSAAGELVYYGSAPR